MNEKTPTLATVEARMFVAGDSPTSMKALRNWKSLESRPGMESVRLEIVDVLEEPGKALENGVLATPMLLLAGTGHTFRCMGTLEDGDYVMDLIERCLG